MWRRHSSVLFPWNVLHLCVASTQYVLSDARLKISKLVDAILFAAKAGRCPETPTGPWVCSSACRIDGDCRGRSKCCRNRCGAFACTKPEAWWPWSDSSITQTIGELIYERLHSIFTVLQKLIWGCEIRCSLQNKNKL